MVVKIKDIGEIITGNTPSKKEESYWDSEDICFVKPDIISDTGISIIEDSNEYISKNARNRARVVGKGTVLVTCIGSIGKVGIVSNDESAFNQQINAIVPYPTVNARYLAYAMIQARQRLEAIANAPVVPIINKTQFGDFQINIENDVSKQEIIVLKLDKLCAIIESRKKELAKLDELTKARFVEMFGDPMVNSKRHAIKTYGELFELNAGGTPSKTKPEYWENGTISWIGSNLCQNVILYENDGKYISQEGYDHSSAKLFPIDTVLIALVGATIGKTALLKFETTTNQNVLGVRHITESGYNPMFVYYYTQFLYKKFMNIGDGGFNMASKGFVSELPMYDIDLQAQNEFSSFAEQVDKSKAVVKEALREAQLMFDSFMQQYFG